MAFNYLLEESEKQKHSLYREEAKKMQKRVLALILEKQKATLAIALSLGNDKRLAEDMLNGNIGTNYYKELISRFRNETQYKNIWIQILDKNLTSLYRSWTQKSGDNLSNIRTDLVSLIKHNKTAYSISTGKFDLSLKAMVPIFNNGKIIGIIEVISHFNSISKEMKKFHIDSTVLLEKKFKNNLKYPFTRLFVGEYYVANFDAPLYMREYLNSDDTRKYFTKSYLFENNYIMTSIDLLSLNGETLGHYVMFKDVENISMKELDFFMFKWIVFIILLIMILLILVGIVMYYLIRKQRQYYKNIIDSSTNIVTISSDDGLLDVNRSFFQYFDRYSSVEELKKEHLCICDFFVQEEGYLYREMNGTPWREYIIQHPEKNHKVKVEYLQNVYYFFVNVSKISQEKDHYSVVFSDITNEELYKRELEHLSVTDSLTKVKNRHYFDDKIDDEIIRANRYEYGFSLIMFDIDHFKRVNDEHGHQAGDSVLIEYSKLISKALRESDILCRVGGEEFMVILPYTEKERAGIIAEKSRVIVEEYKKVVPITMSFGVAEYRKNEGYISLYKRVDDALYKAKKIGRNRVVVAE